MRKKDIQFQNGKPRVVGDPGLVHQESSKRFSKRRMKNEVLQLRLWNCSWQGECAVIRLHGHSFQLKLQSVRRGQDCRRSSGSGLLRLGSNLRLQLRESTTVRELLLPSFQKPGVQSQGWLVPINICGWDNSTRPPALRSRSAQACWAHETDWDRLALMRQPLNVQCRTFLFILRELFRYMQVPWEITLKRSLHHLGHAFPVQTLPYRPHATCDGNSMQRLQGLQQGGTLVSCLTRGYSVMTPPRPPPRPLGSFDLIWNRRKAYTK